MFCNPHNAKSAIYNAVSNLIKTSLGVTWNISTVQMTFWISKKHVSVGVIPESMSEPLTVTLKTKLHFASLVFCDRRRQDTFKSFKIKSICFISLGLITTDNEGNWVKIVWDGQFIHVPICCAVWLCCWILIFFYNGSSTKHSLRVASQENQLLKVSKKIFGKQGCGRRGRKESNVSLERNVKVPTHQDSMFPMLESLAEQQGAICRYSWAKITRLQ